MWGIHFDKFRGVAVKKQIKKERNERDVSRKSDGYTYIQYGGEGPKVKKEEGKEERPYLKEQKHVLVFLDWTLYECRRLSLVCSVRNVAVLSLM